MNKPLKVTLDSLRNANEGSAITVWKDGTWKRWQRLDAKYAEQDENWLCTISTPADEAYRTSEGAVTEVTEDEFEDFLADDCFRSGLDETTWRQEYRALKAAGFTLTKDRQALSILEVVGENRTAALSKFDD